jgi:hypothetical protein
LPADFDFLHRSLHVQRNPKTVLTQHVDKPVAQPLKELAAFIGVDWRFISWRKG